MVQRGSEGDVGRQSWLEATMGGAALVALVGLSSMAWAQTGYGPPPTDPTEAAPTTPTGPAAAQAGEGGGAAEAGAEGGGAEGGGEAGDASAEEEVVEEDVSDAPPPEDSADGGGDDVEVLEPSSRPWLGEFGIGPGIFMLACGGGRCASADGTTQVKMRQLVGYHLSGDGEGFALGLNIDEAFGSGLFRFQPGLRLWADIPVADDMAIYVSPYGQLGYSLYTLTLTGIGSGTTHFFNWQLGAAARVVLGDRWSLSFTPIGFDWVANGDGMIWSYDLGFGFGATF
jgi:hypothetical protein